MDNHHDPAIKKYAYIDCLRGLAIIGVIYIHNYNYFDFKNSNLPLWFLNAVEYGQLGIQLFFIASAFTLCLSLESRKKNETNFLRNFFIRRFFRIAPLFYLILIVVLLTSDTSYSILNIFSNFCFLYVFHPIGYTGIVTYSWTIGVEMLFYAIFPILFSKITNLNKAIVVTLLVVLFNLLLYHIVVSNLSFIQINIYNISFEALKTFFYKSLIGQLPIFLLGFILFHLKKTNLKAPHILWLLLVFAIHLAFDSLVANHFLFGIVLMTFSLWLSYSKRKFFVNPITIHIGKVSYSMYLTHAFVLAGLKKLGAVNFTDNILLNIQLRFALVLGICFLISKMLYHLIEKPGIQLGQSLINRISTNIFNAART